jgi:hypothetical protein
VDFGGLVGVRSNGGVDLVLLRLTRGKRPLRRGKFSQETEKFSEKGVVLDLGAKVHIIGLRGNIKPGQGVFCPAGTTKPETALGRQSTDSAGDAAYRPGNNESCGRAHFGPP